MRDLKAYLFYTLWLRLLVVGFCLIFLQGYAQPDIIRFQRLTDEEGLPNNLFREVIQDHQGVLWMAGLNGVASYDGYNVKSFRHSHIDSTSISGNNITAIFEDSKGRLWLGVKGYGINVSDDAKSVFKQIGFPLGQTDMMLMTVTDLAEDTTGGIWVATNMGPFIIREDKNQFVLESFTTVFGHLFPDHTSKNLNALKTDRHGHIWMGTTSGLYRFDPFKNILHSPKDFQGLPASEVQDIEIDREGKLWISCAQEGPRLYFTTLESMLFKPMNKIPFLSSGREIQFTFDLDNRMWALVFGEQAYGFDFRDSTLFLQTRSNSDISHERFFRTPFVDHSGNTWLPCEGFYIYPYPKGINTYLHPFAFHQSNSCIYGTEDDLWFAYREKGIVRLDQTTGEVVHYSSEGQQGLHIPVDHVQDILKLRNGNYIIVGFSNIAVMNPEGLVIRSHSVNGTNRAAYQDSEGRIWIGGYHGLYLFSETNGVLDTIQPSSAQAGGVFIQTIVEDSKGRMWFASDVHGLCMYDPKTEEVRQFIPTEGDTLSFPSLTVLDIVLGQNDLLWAATDVALVRFDLHSFAITSYDRSDGLGNDFISAVVCADNGWIWMSTHSGISAFDPVREQFVNYGRHDGLSNFSYYSRSSYYSDSGVLYFGGKNGVDYFHPDSLRDNPTAPKMFLSSLTINNDRIIGGYSLKDFTAGLELSYTDKLLEFEFAGLHFAAQEDVRYMYRMEGIHDDWIDLGQQRTVLFSGLRPGKYVFHAKAITGDQIWSEEELMIPITISPPFYATTWFRIIITLILLGLLYTIINARERSIKRKDKAEAEVNRKIVELERRALQAQMNPHFIYNSMNSIQQFMIIHDIEGAMKYLTKFSRILRTVLNISAQNRIPLADEITLIKDYLELENMRFPNKFTYDIQVSPDINIHAVDIPPFFIQPQVENAIRHGLLKKSSQGHLSIAITSDEGHLYIIVEDNGIGREASRKTKFNDTIVNESKGLAIVKERLSHLSPTNGFTPFKIIDLYTLDHTPAGTRVEIILPID